MLSCIDATQTGDITASGKIWTYDKIDRSLSTVSIADGLLYVADTFEGLHCLDAETGQCYWIQPSNAEIWGSTAGGRRQGLPGHEEGPVVLAAGRERKLLGRDPSRLARLLHAGGRQRRALRRLAALPLGGRSGGGEAVAAQPQADGRGRDGGALCRPGPRQFVVAAGPIRQPTLTRNSIAPHSSSNGWSLSVAPGGMRRSGTMPRVVLARKG